MHSPADDSPRCIPIALALCLLLSLPVFLMMFVDVNAAPFPQLVANAHIAHHPAAMAKPVLPPAAHPLP